MNNGLKETGPDIRVVVAAGMKLRYIDIGPEIISDLQDWSEADVERESELTLKDLGISREPHESYLRAWARVMLDENGCADKPEDRKRLIESIQQDKDVLRFVWVLGGEEREQFRLDDSPALRECLARRAADDALMAAFAQAPDTFNPRGGEIPELERFSEIVAWVWMVLWALLPLVGIVIVRWRGDAWIPRIFFTTAFGAGSGYSLILLAKEFPCPSPRTRR